MDGLFFFFLLKKSFSFTSFGCFIWREILNQKVIWWWVQAECFLGQSRNINPYEEKSLNPTLCCSWVKGIVQYLRGLSVLLALENNETEEDYSKKQNDCFTPARQETRCKLMRRGYEEHLQLNICPVLLLCLSLHHLPPRLSFALHLPVLPLYLSPCLMCTATHKKK